MNNKSTQSMPDQAVDDNTELVFGTDELEQLAKFLDALLEVDIANRNNEGNL